MRRLRSAVVALTFLVGARPVSAQEKAPHRPHLDVSADTNSAGAYYFYGLDRLRQKGNADAADAFYWASRLDPSWADPLYARRVALLISNPHRLLDYVNGESWIYKSKEIQAIDSLQYFSMLRDPFMHRGVDRMMLNAVMDAAGEDPSDLTASGLSPSFRAWMAYTNAQLVDAIAYYSKAIQRDKKDFSLHADRAQPLFLMGQFDSAAVEMQTAIDMRAQADEKKLVYVYESKAMQLYQLGWIRWKAGEIDKARDAFGQALTEDLGFYRAHMAMASLALQTGDTAQAEEEFGLAVDLNGTDPALRTTYGLLLTNRNENDKAITQLQSAIATDSDYAMPYYVLGQALEASGKKADAYTAYEQFIARAPQSMGDQIQDAQDHAVRLKGSHT